MSGARIPFGGPGLREDAASVRDAIDRVLASGWYILGPEVQAFETEFAAFVRAAHAVGVGTGTDAIALALKALSIGPGDEVITTPLSAAYTSLAIVMAGARPVFADVDDRLTLDPDAVAASVTSRTKAIVPVHLYGQAADMAGLERVASRHHLAIVEDCCQAHGGTAEGRPVGTIGVAGAFSFYPTKNLGALGDAGAMVTGDRQLAERVKRLRNGGQTSRYHHQEAGVNSRLDEVQAAILRARLPFLPAWTARRRALASRYRASLANHPVAPIPERDPGHVYHLFVVRAPSQRPDASRAALAQHLHAKGIETLVHYPIPIPDQPAFTEFASDCPAARAACAEILSLPLHPGLTDEDAAAVASAAASFRPATVAR